MAKPNARALLERACREDPKLEWPHYVELQQPGLENVWQVECRVVYYGQTLRAIVKANAKKKARAGAAEAVHRLYLVRKSERAEKSGDRVVEAEPLQKQLAVAAPPFRLSRKSKIIIVVVPSVDQPGSLLVDATMQLLADEAWIPIRGLFEAHGFYKSERGQGEIVGEDTWEPSKKQHTENSSSLPSSSSSTPQTEHQTNVPFVSFMDFRKRRSGFFGDRVRAGECILHGCPSDDPEVLYGQFLFWLASSPLWRFRRRGVQGNSADTPTINWLKGVWFVTDSPRINSITPLMISRGMPPDSITVVKSAEDLFTLLLNLLDSQADPIPG